jgi:hypothetical protein
MTSEERREARYQRRKAKRLEKQSKRLEVANDFDKVFSYENLYKSYKHCRKGVAWKVTVQKYIAEAPMEVYRTWLKLQQGIYKSPGFYEFDLYERGKLRHIRSTSIRERVVQNCLCEHALIPALLPTFIFDNGASMKNKGYTFAINRLTEHLHRHYRKHGQDGYILIFDFSKFFDNVSHELVKKLISDKITDERVNKLAAHFIDMFGEKGLGLGSQISQVLALASANKLDHVIKEVYRIKGYARYMDDGYLISHSKGYLHACLRAIKAVCEELGIVLNKKKTQIVKLSHGFTWLKVRFFLTPTGKVIRKIYKRSVTKERQKLKKLRKKLDQGKMTYFDVWQSFQSWRAYAYTFNAYHTVQNMEKLFKDLFHKEIFNEVYGIAC